MSLHTFTIEEKIGAVEVAINEARKTSRPPGSPNQRHYEVLKAVAADLRGRQRLPRNNALGALAREIESMKKQKCHGVDFGYDTTAMARVTSVLINKWPVVAQALEQFGELSAE